MEEVFNIYFSSPVITGSLTHYEIHPMVRLPAS